MADPMNQPSPSQGSGIDPNLASTLSYVCGLITGILFLLIDKDNKTVRFHAWNSILFNIATIILSIAFSVLSTIIINISFWMYSAFSIVYMIVWLALFVVWLVSMVKAFQGSVFEIPVITDLARKQAEK
jgi:uncharacterized membrane protein